MATVTGLTAERMLAIEAGSVVSGTINGAGHLILTKHDGSTIDAGYALLAVPSATATGQGVVELATNAETATGTDTVRAVTPAGMKSVTDTLQPLDSDLTTIGGLTPANDDVVQRKAGAWTNRTMAQLAADLIATGSFSGGGGSTTYVPFITVGPTGSGAALITDGVADEVQINSALSTLASAGGGIVWIAPGTYNLAASITIAGNANTTGISRAIVGSGSRSTILVAASNIDAIALSAAATVTIRDMEIRVVGTGSAITSTQGTSSPVVRYGMYNSTFENLYIQKNGASAHTGWAFNLGNPYRSRFTNIAVSGLHNGIKLYSQDASFGGGICYFERISIDLDTSTGSIGIQIDTPSSMASLNQNTFTTIELSDNAASGTGIILGTASSNGSSRNVFINTSVTAFATVLNVIFGSNNIFDFEYVSSRAAGTFFQFASASNGNHIRSVSMGDVGANTISYISDSNTDLNQPNILENANVTVPSGGTANATTTTATRIRNSKGSNSGTLAAALNFQRTEYGEVFYWNGSAFVRAQGARIYIGGSADPTSNNGDVWIH